MLRSSSPDTVELFTIKLMTRNSEVSIAAYLGCMRENSSKVSQMDFAESSISQMKVDASLDISRRVHRKESFKSSISRETASKPVLRKGTAW